MSKNEYKYIVRIFGNDIQGDKKIISGLTQIRGIGHHFAKTLLNILKIKNTINIGYLTDEQIHNIENIIKDSSVHFQNMVFK